MAIMVAFSGCAGSGKTTLAKEISRQYGYSLRPEGSEEIFGKHRIRPPETLINVNKEVRLKAKSAQEDFLASFIKQDNNFAKLNINTVCDRSPVDAIAYYLYWCNSVVPKKDYEVFEKIAKKHSKIYNATFVFPPIDKIFEEGVRSSNYVYQETIFILVVGILNKWGLEYKILETTDSRERVREIGKFLQELKK